MTHSALPKYTRLITLSAAVMMMLAVLAMTVINQRQEADRILIGIANAQIVPS